MLVRPIKPQSLLYTGMLAGLASLPPLSIDMNLPAIPAIEASLGVASGQGALTFSLFLLGFAIAPIVGGPVADRFGRRPTLLLSLLFTSIAAFSCMIAPSFRTLLIFRLIQGIASGICILLPLAIVRDTLSESEAPKLLSRIMLVVAVAPLIAPIIGAWVLSWSDWRTIHAVQGGLSTLLLLLTAMGFEETLEEDRRTPLSMRQIGSAYAEIATSKTFLGFSFLMAFTFGCMFSYISGSPGLLQVQLGLSENLYSLVFAFTSFGIMCGSYISYRLGKRDVPARSIINRGLACMVVAVAAALVLVLNGFVHLETMAPALFLIMMCAGTIQPNCMAEAVAPLPHIAGTASGALNSLQMFIGSAASACVTFLTGYFTPALAMMISMACSIALAFAVYHGLRTGRAPGKLEMNPETD
ncbi:MFS transporter, DHA1 family, bicyclomycin/chloramphenicol resistance protein [Desulfatibacillum alkenivorans DSM 16219]|uniref:MFS transporter, DHA1 family, bicyclomycin/chloramphenicol resistance protein n=1 Tax=Desulfatibacillum alkenivorans DSM 16219 TaxID=1121393 RepID=A0A1M6XIV4_9BACT|nr:multidrug effflux MFS transporter [Desulfatibacillum alkenivorans]SHL05789.1 MFS transporter, DHA1 family, bicyclomycin/chloramphenicol resistance protein [Desulfatibacillum alkenivorans DSM 16219]